MPPHRMVSSQFWTGETGRLLREKPSDTKVTAFYLMTSPHAHMCGLYYVPLPFVVHETGLERKVIDDSLDILRDLKFAFYDHGTEFVWVKEMAHWQLDAPLKPRDSRIPTVQRWYAALPPNIFLGAFHDRYCQELQLSERRGSPLVPPESPINAPLTPRPRGADAPTYPIPDPIPDPVTIPSSSSAVFDFSVFRSLEVDDDPAIAQDQTIEFLTGLNFTCKKEYQVEIRDGDRLGRIDIVAQKDGQTLAIEFDTRSPRYKSIEKLLKIPNAVRIILLRGSDFEDFPVPEGIHRVMSIRLKTNRRTQVDFEAAFEERWLRYPVKDGKKEARRHWLAHVTTEDALRDFDTALDNYMQHLKITGYTPKNGNTYFNNWHDYINWQEPVVPLGVNRNGQREYESNGERLIRKQHEESERARDLLRRTTGHGPGSDHPDGPGDPLRRSIAGSH